MQDSPTPEPIERLARLRRRAAAVIGFERVWPAAAIGLSLAALFIAAIWSGALAALPVTARLTLALIALAAILGLPAWAFLRARTTPQETLARIDRDSGLPHRPATALDDGLATPHPDPATRALWEAHRARALKAAEALKVSPPAPGLARHDPYALRFVAPLLLAIAFFATGSERWGRLVGLFDQGVAQEQLEATKRIDAWLDPPAYTQVPPVILNLAKPGKVALRVPVNSVLVLRSSDGATLAPKLAGGLESLDVPQAQDGAREWRWTLKKDASFSLGNGEVELTAIPDNKPSIRYVSAPQPTPQRDALVLNYAIADDYGVVSAEARMTRSAALEASAKKKPLIPAPPIPLMLPGAPNREGEAKTNADISQHPWAGAEIALTLYAKDEAGQEGQSETMTFTLPQRNFSNPLARALVEQRRDLILDPAAVKMRVEAMRALLIEPTRFTPDPSVYLGLRTITNRLVRAKTDADLIATADLMWEMALALEDGGMSDVEKALKQAQENLREALERGASPEEMRKLTEDLRRAMDRYMRELAERMRQNPNNQQATPRDMQNMRIVTPRDLRNMLNRMEELARRGDTAEAQKLLEQLNEMMRNLQMARPGQMERQRRQAEMEKNLDELDRMTREQQELRDETFQEGQKRQEEIRRGQRNQRQQQQQGQRGQRQQQQGQQGQQQGEPQEGAEQGDQQQQQQRLGQRQQQLRQQLEQLKRRMQEQGMQGEQGLEDAEDAMKQAEGALGQGNEGEAVDAQGRALEGLRRGGRNMARQMQQQQQGQPGEEGDDPSQMGEGPGGPGEAQGRADNDERNDDPLGRPTPSQEAGDRSKLRKGGRESTLEQRAREVMDELRRRLGDPNRLEAERDYLERLLRTP